MSDSATLCLSLAFALLHLGQYAEALVECEKAIALKPDRALAYYIRGQTMARLEQCDDAIADYDKAIELNPDDANAYAVRGMARARLGNMDEANEDFQTTLKLAEGSGDESLKAFIESAVRTRY